MADPISETGTSGEKRPSNYISKEEKLRTLQADFEKDEAFWKEQKEKARQEGNHLIAIACGDKADKYRDLIRILKILNS